MIHRNVLGFWLLAAGVMIASPSLAQVTAPVVPTAPKMQAIVSGNPPPPGQTAPTTRKLVMKVSFAQHHVDFEQKLAKAIQNTEKDNPNATYDVVSSVPAADKAKSDRQNDNAASNLSAVAQVIQGEGVPGVRIRTSMQNSAKGSGQEVQIFVE